MYNKGSSSKTPIWVALFLLLGLATTSVRGQDIKPGFYSKSCPDAESITRKTVKKHLELNPRIAPGILRLSFHDCFVRGCDASVLIDGPDTEKAARPNSGINGYNVIDDIKTQLEAKCPGIVSCADIIQLAARDSVLLTKGTSWQVPTGRRDGFISILEEADELPGPTETAANQTAKLAKIGLSQQDLVTLLGSHTIGTTSCRLFNFRLYNFSSSNPTDPFIDSSFVPILKEICPDGRNLDTRVFLDHDSGTVFDFSWFTNLSRLRAVLQSDSLIWLHPDTQAIMNRFISGELNFKVEFGRAMIKMSKVKILTGTKGEIRKVCSAINSNIRQVTSAAI